MTNRRNMARAEHSSDALPRAWYPTLPCHSFEFRSVHRIVAPFHTTSAQRIRYLSPNKGQSFADEDKASLPHTAAKVLTLEDYDAIFWTIPILLSPGSWHLTFNLYECSRGFPSLASFVLLLGQEGDIFLLGPIQGHRSSVGLSSSSFSQPCSYSRFFNWQYHFSAASSSCALMKIVPSTI
ncbi:hypothetical protein BDV26DRAFT_253451 [Aspergillus bertholletiae]|uniref:Uncharacterized protein n=1 Tax=Aspergillus bertholletiae TaxID=1226010 RepID=A0A5N7BL18_9EURO|nr:hypothetical protein BDV26DRAFT_253451 [Aspergillus bertholletiae]